MACANARRPIKPRLLCVARIQRELKLVACSAVRSVDANTPLAQALTRELNATPGDEPVTWLDDRSPLAATWQTTNLARVNFRDTTGELVASALLAWSQPVSTDKVQVVLQLAAHAIAPILTLHTRSSSRAWSQTLGRGAPHVADASSAARAPGGNSRGARSPLALSDHGPGHARTGRASLRRRAVRGSV